VGASKAVIVEKGWGHEEIFADTPDYCGKLLCFKTLAASSLHLHRYKTETWRCLSGEFVIDRVDPVTTETATVAFRPGDVFHLPAMTIHRLSCLTEGVVIEVSTHDDENDNYRVSPGDSQIKGSR
jgi:mannose-6-phosphate isomerase